MQRIRQAAWAGGSIRFHILKANASPAGGARIMMTVANHFTK